MRCGICGNDSPTYEAYGFARNTPPTVLPVYDAGDLMAHKRQQHPVEYKAGLQQRKDTKAEHERARLDYERRRREAGQAAGRVALYRWSYAAREPELTHTAAIDSYHRLEDYRYPNPITFALYQEHLAEIASLQDQAAQALRSAYEYGTPVPQEDVDRVKAAMDAVPREEVPV